MEKHKQAVPVTLLEATRYFSDPDVCVSFVARLRWPNGPHCPRCGVSDPPPTFIKTRRVWKCRFCHKQFSVKVGTIFEDSPIKLDKWLVALWMLVNCRNGVSSYEVARTIGVTQKSAWFMLHRIRLATQAKSFERLKGEVEVDETFIGGKARYQKPPWRKPGDPPKPKRAGHLGKVAVVGLLERHGPDGVSRVRLKPVKGVKKADIVPVAYEGIEPGAEVFTDSLRSYDDFDKTFVHHVVNHAEEYAIGRIHTNGLENFWSLLKRTIKGTYVNVEPFHLFRYLDEQSFRFNTRDLKDHVRFIFTLSRIVGRRLTYKALIGNPETQTA